MAFGFENLRVWQISIKLCSEFRAICRTFPVEERFVLSSQFIRAIDSVALNISEGSGGTPAEFRNFLRIGIRSTLECVTCLYVAEREKYISKEQFNDFYERFNSLVKQLHALRNSIK